MKPYPEPTQAAAVSVLALIALGLPWSLIFFGAPWMLFYLAAWGPAALAIALTAPCAINVGVQRGNSLLSTTRHE